MNAFIAPHDPKLDLVLDREIDVPVELVWEVWTTPEHLKQWFCPKPWGVTQCTIDLRPGGVFATTMRSPEGEEFPNLGCFLEVVPLRRLVFTDTLLPGFRPAPKPFMTGSLTLEPIAKGTRYIATAIHGDEAARKSHEDMGFHHGWATALDQMIDHIKTELL
jgi:uncharacterized protein YndB with AHSA1/START domain